MPAWTTPELCPVCRVPTSASPSSTQTLSPGRRAISSRATARPRIPPPTTAMSCLSAITCAGYATSVPALEIVIVSSTGALELLRTCLRTLRENPYTGGETLVHVVDNASTDGTPEMVRAEYPEVRLHALDWEAGLCIANNVAL